MIMDTTQHDHMVIIRLTRPFGEDLAALLPEEQRILEQWGREGRLTGSWVRSDMGGAFLLVRAEGPEAVQAMIETLPLHPHMETQIVPVRSPG